MVAEAPTSPAHELTIPAALPVLPLRGGMVVLPLAVMPLLIGQPRSVQLIDDVMRKDRLLVPVAPRTEQTDQPTPDDMYRVGTAAIVHQLARLPDGTLRVVLQGLERVRLLDFVTTERYLVARVELAPDQAPASVETEALRRAQSTCSDAWLRSSTNCRTRRPAPLRH
jgi:ATP-dependent Lon protease